MTKGGNGDLEGNISAMKQKNPNMVDKSSVRGTRGPLKEDNERNAGRKGMWGREKVALHHTNRSSSFGSPGPSIPSTSPLGVRYIRRQEPANSLWYKNLTLGCPAKGEGPT